MKHKLRRDGSSQRPPRGISRKTPYIVAAVYAVVSAGWIAFSDRLLVSLAGTYRNYQELQTFKGWLFVVATTIVILVALRSAWNRILAAYDSSRESEERLHMALVSARGGIWERTKGPDGSRVTYISPEFVERFGFSPDLARGLDEFHDRLHPDDRVRLEHALAEVDGSDQPYDVRFRLRAVDGSYCWLHSRGNVVKGGNRQPDRIVGVALDVTEQVEAERRINQLLRYDPMTGLARSSTFLSDVEDALGSDGTDGAFLGLLQIRLPDLEHLVAEHETIEDARTIRLISERLGRMASSGILASRISTDIFAVSTPRLETAEAVQCALSRVLERLAEPLDVSGRTVHLRLKAGAALHPQDGTTAQTLLRNSGHALASGGTDGEGHIHWFTEGLDEAFRRRSERLQALAEAVARGEIAAHFQPVVDMTSGETAGFEALARWRRANEGLVPPDQFIGLAEQYGHIREIGREVLRQACGAAAGWRTDGIAPFVAVNVSPRQLDDPDFPEVVASVLAETGLAPDRLELEITENALPADPEVAAQRLGSLRALGISIAVDDFGTGYSSLSVLARLPFTRLKIDRTFVGGYGVHQQSTIIVDTIIDLCRSLRLSITAEGIETPEQADLLCTNGVALAQGYYFSRPVPPADAEALLGHQWPVRSGQEPPHLQILRLASKRMGNYRQHAEVRADFANLLSLLGEQDDEEKRKTRKRGRKG